MKATILCYHRVAPKTSSDRSQLIIPPEVFRDQLKSLKKKWNFVELSEIHESRAPNSIAITFDDGSKDWVNYAAPILHELSIPASFFISTQFVEEDIIFLPIALSNIFDHSPIKDRTKFLESFGVYSSFVNYEETLELIKGLSGNQFWSLTKGVSDFARNLDTLTENDLPLTKLDLFNINESKLLDLGLHTATHVRISNLDRENLVSEFSTSLESFKNWGIQPSNFFPIPFGQKSDYKDDQIIYIKQIFDFVPMSVEPLPIGKVKVLPRISVQNWSPEYLKRVLNYSQIFSYMPQMLEVSMKARRNFLKVLD